MNVLVYLAAVGGLGLVATILVGTIMYNQYEGKRLDQEVEAVTLNDGEEAAGHGVEFGAVDVKGGLLGLVSAWRHRARAKRMARKGYVRWYKLGAQMESPKWVKPEYKGRGVPEYRDSDDDSIYLFPEEAMVTDAHTGAWIAMHRLNEADPINLRDPVMPSIPGDRLDELLNLYADAEKPGMLDNLDLSNKSMAILGIVLLFIVYAATQVML